MGADVAALRPGWLEHSPSLRFSAFRRRMNDVPFLAVHQRSIDEAKLESLAEACRARRQRKLDKVEIPEDKVIISDELLGRGGFGEVFLAKFNGRNAAVKVRDVAHSVKFSLQTYIHEPGHRA